MGIVQGKRALIVGVANEKSLAWSIAQTLAAEGAEIALTYQGEILEKRVRPLAAQIQADVIGELDVNNDAQIASVFAALKKKWNGLDLLVHAVAFAEREDLRDRFLTVSRANFAKSMEISAYSLVALARAAEPLMEARGGGSCDPQLQHDGRGQGSTGSLRTLPVGRSGGQEYTSQRAQRRARAHALVVGDSRLPYDGARGRGALAAAARDEDRGSRQDGGGGAERFFERRHGPDALRGRGLQYRRGLAARSIAMPIVTVAQLSDNYAYLVIDDGSKDCAVVDCAEPDKVIAAAKSHGAKIVAVLTTHWHGDHCGGNNEIASKVPGIKVYGASAEGGRIPALTNPVADGGQIRIGALEGRVIGIPAHTNGHVAYYFPTLSAVFTGDTMFVGGCGRVFEGKASTMVASLRKLAALPDSTQVYCGHEYTEKNLRFALTLEPGNQATAKKHQWSLKTRAEKKFTVPSTIGDEKQTNPFLRTDSPELRANLKHRDPSVGDDPIAIFAKVRELKDHF